MSYQLQLGEESMRADWIVPFAGKTARGFGYENVRKCQKME